MTLQMKVQVVVSTQVAVDNVLTVQATAIGRVLSLLALGRLKTPGKLGQRLRWLQILSGFVEGGHVWE